MSNEHFAPIRIHQWGYGFVKNWCYSEDVFTSAFWRFWLNREKGAFLHFGNQVVAMQPKMIYLVPPEADFSTSSDQPFHQLFVHFSLKFPGLEPKNQFYEIPTWDEADSAMNRFNISFDRDSMRDYLTVTGILHTAVSNLPEKCFVDQDQYDPRICLILHLLNGTSLGHYTNAQLAKRINMSESAFIHLFTLQVGRSPQNYYREKRIERAQYLLTFTDISIDNIARDTGFVDRYHFSKIFLTCTGYTPGRYRRLNHI